MAQYIPDGATGYEADLDNLIMALKGNGVLDASDCAVTAQSSPNMTVKSASGNMVAGGTVVAVAATDPITISAADSSNPRIDIVVVNTSTGAVTVVAGTPSASPKPPSLPTSRILLAYVSVPAGAVNIQNSNISDRRLRGYWAEAANLLRDGSLSTPGARWGSDLDTGFYRPGANQVGAVVGGVEVGRFTDPLAIQMPNLVLNSDFGRRNVWGTMMPERFVDTSGYTQIDGGSAPTVASNAATFNVDNHIGWPKVGYNASFWRDIRASAQFKMTSTGATYALRQRYVDTSNFVEARYTNGNFELRKNIAGTPTVVATVAQAGTLNNRYWLEIESQGTTFIAKLYNSGASAAAKSSATLLQTLTGTVSDSAVVAGGVTITSNTGGAVWGETSTGDGGVYVEGWLPESVNLGFTGTLGGQAFGCDEAADAGPNGRQFAPRFYSPATSRGFQFGFNISGDFSVNGKTLPILPSTTYALSLYVKTSGASGNGVTIQAQDCDTAPSAISNFVSITSSTIGAPTSWTRFSGSGATTSGGRYATVRFSISGISGTVWTSGWQLEQGFAVTAWRNAPGDDEPITWQLTDTAVDKTTTSGAGTPVNDRDLGVNIFLPWDSEVVITNSGIAGGSVNTALASYAYVDGVANTTGYPDLLVAAGLQAWGGTTRITLSAGKHRIHSAWSTTAGTATLYSNARMQARLQIVAYRGK